MKTLAKFPKKIVLPLAQKLKIVYKYITFYTPWWVARKRAGSLRKVRRTMCGCPAKIVKLIGSHPVFRFSQPLNVGSVVGGSVI